MTTVAEKLNAYPGYSTTTKGLALIVNNEFGGTKYVRDGSGEDVKGLKDLLEKNLNYDVEVERDVTSVEVLTIFEKFSKNEKHKDGDSVIVVIMSHGCEDGIYFKDEKAVKVETLTSCLTVENAPYLAKKPKLFIINSCRGAKLDYKYGSHICLDTESEQQQVTDSPDNVSTDAEETDSDFIKNTSCEGDFLILYATPFGYKSYRHQRHGSRFVRGICAKFAQYAKSFEIKDLFYILNDWLSTRNAEYVQVAEMVSRLHKRFYFFPDYAQQQLTYDNINIIRAKLKYYLKTDVEVIFKYWNKLGALRMDTWENFYNTKMIMSDQHDKPVTNVNTFTDLFKDRTFRRIVVSAPAGYGKSTFVHEMTRQWVNRADWAEHFSLVFLFRLGDIRPSSKCTKENPLSIEDLLQKCLLEDNVQLVKSCFENKQLWDKTLFVFDGFDELQKDLIDDDLYDLIIGTSSFKPYVVVTSRPTNFDKVLHMLCNVYIELHGFTEEGAMEQLRKFDMVGSPLPYDIVKVPLFLTLLGILHRNKTTDLNQVTNPCNLIDRMIKFLITRYRKYDATLTDTQEKELLDFLAQHSAAQTTKELCWDESLMSQFSEQNRVFLSDLEPLVYDNLLSLAKSSNIILPSSFEKHLFFPHKMLDDYFAAMYWSEYIEVEYFKLGGFCNNMLRFERNLYILFDKSWSTFSYQFWFSAFLCYFNPMLKTKLWNNLKTLPKQLQHVEIPMLDEYDSLEPIEIKRRRKKQVELNFEQLSDRTAKLAMENLIFSDSVSILKLKFTADHMFVNLSNVTKMKLKFCSIAQSTIQFFTMYNPVSLVIDNCYFESVEQNDGLDDSFVSKVLNLSQFKIKDSKGISSFVSGVLEIGQNLKFLSVSCEFNDFSWFNWINSERNFGGRILCNKQSRAIKNSADVEQFLREIALPQEPLQIYITFV